MRMPRTASTERTCTRPRASTVSGVRKPSPPSFASGAYMSASAPELITPLTAGISVCQIGGAAPPHRRGEAGAHQAPGAGGGGGGGGPHPPARGGAAPPRGRAAPAPPAAAHPPPP